MNLKEQYKKQSGFDVGEIHTVGMVYYSDDYVGWLEDNTSNQKLKHQLFIGKVICEIGFNKTNELVKEVNQTFGK